MEKTLKGQEISSAVTAIQSFLTFLNQNMDSRRKNDKKTVLKAYTQIFNNNLDDVATIKKCLDGFSIFLYSYPKTITVTDLLELSRGTEICYGNSGKISLEIQKYVHLNRDNEKFLNETITHIENIRQYCSKMPSLPGVEEGSELDSLIKEIFPEIASLVRSLGLKGNEMSRELVSKLTGSDVTAKLISRLKDLSAAGKLDTRKVYEQIKNAMVGADPTMAKFFGQLQDLIKGSETYYTAEEASSLLDELGEKQLE